MKNKGISRKKNRLMIVLLILLIALLIVFAFTQNTVLWIAALLVLISDFVLCFTTNRCPECGAFFGGMYWSRSAGHCRKCGAEILFDDEVE